MKMSNKTYDKLKWLVTIVLPAAATLYFTLSGIWGFPCGEQVVGTIAAITAFLGVCLGISTVNYNKTNVVKVFNEDLLKEQLALEYMAQEENTNDEDAKEEE